MATRRLLCLGVAAVVAVALAFGVAGPAGAASTGGPLSDREVQRELDKASSLIRAARFDAAIDVLKEVVDANPRSADAWNLLGYSYRGNKRYDSALSSYRRALRLEPQHRGALEYLGELYLETGRRAEAERTLARLRAACPEGCPELEDLERAFADAGSARATR